MESLDNYVIGVCIDMCPDEEIKMRERERLLHILEVVPGTEKDRKPKPDKNRMVKSFSRSAAGKTMQDPKNLRPPNVLLKTINYLLDDIMSRDEIAWTVIYDFVMDRLRSVRQDMVIQNASRAHYICILQPIIRFHAYAAYRLCEESTNNFDPFINNTHLQECLKRVLCMYDDCEEMSNATGGAIDMFGDFLVESRPHFEALYLMVNLGNAVAITRVLSLSRKWRTNLVDTALKVSLYFRNGNYIRTCRVMKKLPTLLSAVAALHLPELRRKALLMMSVAYSSKNLVIPASALKEMLLYDNENQVVSDCKHYGLEIKHNGVCFLKTSFNENANAVSPKHHQFVDDKLKDTNISTLLLFGD